MTTDYKGTTLWKAAFSRSHLTEEEGKASAKLTSTLDEIDSNVSDLLNKIPESCKHLTIHDIRHIHQLWHVASTICGGEDYPINPLEGFVLGVAFLIHDAGLTDAAYPGRDDGLRQTKLYKDMLAIELKREDGNREITDGPIDNASSDQKDTVLFALLRKIHADRALKLLDEAYIHPLTGHNWTLIPSNLLFDLGLPIGEIAASHHWDMSRVENEFGDPLSPPAAFPWWPIDALKLACILRCADACAIDERRAPFMAFILDKPTGVSRDHWTFQGYLNPAHLPRGREGLVIRSKRPMTREHMNAWWFAYEAVTLADRELRDCDRLLDSRAGQGDHEKQIPFAAKWIEGAGDASRFAGFVKASGWTPIDTAVRISDPLALIERLGGRHLYGNDHTAPLRELVQNAADAVRARRSRGGYGPGTKYDAGRIQISIQRLEAEWVLRVIDDGIGMPEVVLSGTFLDFGKSLWQSDRVASLYPGLVSDPDFRPTGRFGIGFYASFIIGQNIKVLTKPFNAGDNKRRVLHFIDGIRGRAELRDYDLELDGDWPYVQNTIVEIRFAKDKWLSNFASLSLHGSVDYPIFSSEERYWELLLGHLSNWSFAWTLVLNLPPPFSPRRALIASTFLKRQTKSLRKSSTACFLIPRMTGFLRS
jgi:hypothetical protein